MGGLSASAVRRAAAPKVQGLATLSRALRGHPLATTVLFSSVAALLGAPGQANYSAANAALDAAAAALQAGGAPAVSMQWGAWAGAGMAAADPQTAARAARLGVALLRPQQALAALEGAVAMHSGARPGSGAALPRAAPALAAVPIRWRTFLARLPQPPPAFFSALAPHAAAPLNAAAARAAPAAPAPQGAAADAVLVAAQVQEAVEEAVTTVLGRQVAPDEPLMAAGLDSLGAVELRSLLQDAIGAPLPQTLVFDAPTPAAMAAAIKAQLLAALPSAPAADAVVPPRAAPALAAAPQAPHVLAVVAATGRTAAGAAAPERSLLARRARDPVGAVPLGRWDTEDPPSASLSARFCAFLAGVAAFDAPAFGLSAAEAALVDPQQRLLLETAAELLLPAPYGTTNGAAPRAGGDLGVYIGIASSDYASVVKSCGPPPGAFHATASAPSVASGRLAYAFGLRGPAVSVDTACSASLVALHLAGRALLEGGGGDGGGGGGALVGGVHVQAAPTSSSYVFAAGMLSTSGRCKVLDADADGYVRGEAVHALLLQPLAPQVAAGGAAAAPLAVVLGSAVNQDGRSSALTVPSGPAQQEVIRAALAAAGVAPSGVHLLSMHGTGTPLGDPVEVNAAASALLAPAAAPPAAQPLALLASKSWHGHAEPDAGLVALAHAAGAAAAAARTPLLHLRALNPYVAGVLESLGAGGGARRAAAARQAAPLPVGAGERAVVAGTSSFAFMGTNAHVITSTTPLVAPTTAAAADRLPWRRARHWAAPPAHLLARRAGATLGRQVATFAADLSVPQLAYVWDHVVSGSAVFPGVGYFEMAAAAARLALGDGSGGGGGAVVALSGLAILAPLVLPAAGGAPPLLQVELSAADGRLAIRSAAAGGGRATLHVSGAASLAAGLGGGGGDSGTSARERCAAALAARAARLLSAASPAAAPAAATAAGAVASVAAAGAGRNDGCAVDLGALDSFLQLGQVFLLKGPHAAAGASYVPAAVEAVALGGGENSATEPAAAAPLAASAAPRAPAAAGEAVSDFRLLSGAGDTPLCRIAGLTAKPMSLQAPGRAAAAAGGKAAAASWPDDLLFEVEWVADAPTSSAVSEEDEFVDAISALRLPARAPLAAAAAAGLAAAQAALLPPPASRRAPAAALRLAAAPSEAAAGVGALLRTLALELPAAHMAVSERDTLSSGGKARRAALLAAGGPAAAGGGDAFGARRSGGVGLVPRLLPSAAARAQGGFQLQPRPRGALESLVPVAADPRPAPGQALVAVKAVGINFRDVLNVLGMYPGDPGMPGSDFAGVITAGPDAGAAVFGLTTGALALHAACSPLALAPLPPNVSFEEGATTPTVLTTVRAALRQLAGLAPGEALLVHGAAGGVGLAAIQAAAAAGARALGTAGGPAKRALARSLGAAGVANSRDTGFASDLAVGAGGAHVVLNSLTSPGMVGASLALLRRGGRLVEIGKRDVWSATAVAAQRPDVAYSLLAVDFLPDAVLHSLLSQLSADLAAGRAAPLRAAVHDMRAAQAALRQISQARHIGKVVTAAGARRAAAPKAGALAPLRRLLAAAPAAQVVLFSSVAALLGSAGQANYGAANAALDAAAAALSRGGAPVRSVQFGAWAGAGMAAATAAKVEAMGIGSLSPQAGLAALEGAIAAQLSVRLGFQAPSVLAASPFNWPRLLAGRAAPPQLLLEHAAAPPAASEPAGAPRGPTSRASGAALAPAARRRHVEQQVEGVIASVLGAPVAPDAPLMASGLDSLGAVELRSSLEARLGLQLPATLVFDYPSAAALVDALDGLLGAAAGGAAAEPDASTAAAPAVPRAPRGAVGGRAASGGAIAVSAVAERAAHGGAGHGPQALGDAIRRVPLQRWDVEIALTEERPARFGAFLDGAEVSGAGLFDCAPFGLSDKEAAMVDPQQRLLLEAGAQLLAGAPSAAKAAAGGAGGGWLAHVGVFVGISTPDYSDIKKAATPIGVYSATGALGGGVAAGRLSYTFGLRGPCAAVDTACSSSLVATHFATLSMSDGGCASAVVAGVKLILTPSLSAMFSRAGMLAPDGRCKALDAAADGYVRGESLAAMLLHSLPAGGDASDGDQPGGGAAPGWALAVIAGSAVNQDGRSSGLTAPNGPAQQEAVRAALTAAGLSPAEVDVLQLHGTGTPLGDPIEVGAAAAVLCAARGTGAPLTLASDKSAAGHTEPAAGLTGALHALRAAAARAAQPVLHLRTLNPHLASSLAHGVLAALSLPRQARGAAAGGREGGLVSGVSSFAFQGSNAHLLLRVAAPGASCAAAAASAAAQLAQPWRRRYAHVLPPAHALLRAASAGRGAPGRAAFSARLAHPLFSFLWDHAVGLRAVAPGAALLEAALAAGHGLLGGGATTSSSSSSDSGTLGLARVAILAPLVLPAEPAASLELSVEVDTATGAVSVGSAGGGGALGAAVEDPAAAAAAKGATFVPASVALYAPAPRGGGGLPAAWAARDTTALARAAGGGAAGAAPRGGALLRDLRLSAGGRRFCSVDGLESRAVSAAALAGGAAGATAASTAAPRRTVPRGEEKEDNDITYEIVWAADAPGAQSAALEDVAAAAAAAPRMARAGAARAAANALQLLQAAAAAAPGGKAAAGLLFSTALAAPAGAAPTGAAAAGALREQAAWGMLRTAAQEAAGLAVTAAHGDAADPDQGGGAPGSFRLLGPRAPQPFDGYGAAASGGAAFAPRLLRSCAAAATAPYQLVPQPRGALGNLVPVAVDTEAAPAPGGVLLAVKAVGINFRDVLNVLGMYPGDAGDPGSDCAGVVVAANASAGVQPGAAVFGLATGSLGSHVQASALTLVPVPQHVGFEAAATMPTVFITVDTALNQVATLRPGERLLLPAAAGGVGLAGIQLAQALGARVLATAGSPAKRGLLRRLGVEAVTTSRGLGCFEDGGLLGGAHVVLNSLTSPGMVGGALALLRRGGRLVEIGKRDVWSGAAVAAQRPDVAYSLLAVDFMPETGLHAAMARLAGRLAAGEVQPLPGAVHELRNAAAALRQLSQARHVGKVVVRMGAAGSGGSDGAVVVLGGTGTLGSLMVRWLAECGVAWIPAVSRSGRLSSQLGELLAGAGASAARGAGVSVVACDGGAAADAAALEASLCGRPLLGVLHAGGVLADATFANQSARGVRKVFGPKVQALELLQRLLRCHPVATTVLFSSVAALLGAPGQANYSAANATLDAAAAALQAGGLAAVSVQWGAWAGAGMAANDPQTAARVERMGMGMVAPAQGLAALEGALAAAASGGGRPVLAATPIRWRRFLGRLPQPPPALFDAFAAPAPAAAGGAAGGAGGGASLGSIAARVAGAVASVVGRELPPDAPLMESGLDSLGAVELRNALADMFEVELPPTLTFDHPTPAALAGFIAETKYPGGLPAAGAQGAAAAAAALPPGARPPAGPLAGALAPPGAAAAPPLLLLTALSLHAAAPYPRWDVDAVYHPGAPDATAGRVSTRWGTFIPDVHAFDAAAFGLAASEAALMDPQQRALLEEAAAAAAASGRGPRALMGAAGGVFVGCIWLEYGELLAHHGAPGSSMAVTGNGLAFMAGRLSYTFGLSGPCIPTNTACSSSLVAAHLAVRSVRAGESAFGLAAGANAMLLPLGATAAMTQVHALAPDGRCKAFDAAADGYGRGEGFAAAVLESAATAAPGAALAVFAGSAVNQDGRSSGLTAPHGPSQAALVAAAMAEAGAARLDFVAAHGTGTPLGDPIESGALRKSAAGAAGAGGTGDAYVFSVGAVKAATGHLEGTAGLAGLAQALAALRQRAVLPLRYRGLNPYVAGSMEGWGARCRCAARARGGGGCSWRGHAGTSSFGMSGVNAHAILRAAAPGDAPGAPAPPAGGLELVWARRDFQAAAGLPVGHPLLYFAAPPPRSGGGGAVEFAVPLAARPALTFLWDHVVAGRPLLPAAAFLEMAAAAARALLAGGSAGGAAGAAPAPALAATVLAAPLALPPLGGGGSEGGAALVLTCSVDAETGALTLRSGAAGGA
ncbi:MAG: hypothetical protein J3K34DRAFT_383389, partial [Monoraphidium minutum]